MQIVPRRRRALGLTATLVLSCVVAAVAAEPLASIVNPRVRDGTWVTDMTGTLTADTIAQLNEEIGNAERTTGIEMAVVVIRSLEGLSIEDAAAKLFELWGIGKKGKDNGVLFLWATGDRRVRIEVGYGLEGVLPDGKAGAILDTYVVPQFKSGNFQKGVTDGVGAVLMAVRNEDLPLPLAGSESYDSGGSGEGTGVLSMVLGFLGLGTAGIASLVGIGKVRRYRPRSCPSCSTRMTRLDEAHDDEHLGEAQIVEERIGSVDYDVWKCPACAHQFTLRYAKWLSGHDKCPQCQNRTKSSKENVVVAATTSSSGRAHVVETCAFCSFRREFDKVLPRIQQSSSSSGRSSGGGSSFGGGRSGGGGASRGY